MINPDLAAIRQYHQLFPELTPAQYDVVLLYSFGLDFVDMARLRNVSIHTIKNQIDSAREILNVHTIGALRSITLIRLFSAKYIS